MIPYYAVKAEVDIPLIDLMERGELICPRILFNSLLLVTVVTLVLMINNKVFEFGVNEGIFITVNGVALLLLLLRLPSNSAPQSVIFFRVHLPLFLVIQPSRETATRLVRGHGTMIWERRMVEGE